MQVVRLEPKGFFQRRPDPNRPGEWSKQVSAEYRTLYNAARVVNAKGMVLIVEGEKDVDNLLEIGVTATCNPGGAGKWQDNYTELLRDKDVVLVPDNDPQRSNQRTGELMWHPDGRPQHAGQDHMDLVGAALQGVAKSVRILHLPGLPEKGDISDWLEVEGNDKKALAELLKKAPEWAPPVAPVKPMPVSQNNLASHSAANDNFPFVCLGYNKGTYYYLPRGTQQITELSPGGHTKANMLALADYYFWAANFGEGRRGGFDVDIAANEMMRACERKGIFSTDLLRGRGAWWDSGRIVLHCGDRVYVDHTPHAPSAVQSRFVYQLGQPMEANIDNPLDLGGARRFLELVKMMPWAKPIDALYVAGWCAIAHIGGVLSWRPHIWVIGAKGSGKSHVMSAIIKPILGDSCLFVASETTEAGIRQSLGCDAIPVLFDEAEGEDQRAHDRLQRILALVRQSSSETGAKLVKGSATGSAASYQIRSCFAFSSINASLVQQSDRSRVTMVELSKDNHKRPFDEILAEEAKVFNGDFVQRFHARAIAQAGVIRQNTDVFSRVVAAVFGEQRAGDQLGTLLAGAYSLQSDHPATFEEAKAWVEAHDWSEAKEEVDDMSDEKRLYQFIMNQKVSVTLDDKRRDVTVGELVQMTTDIGFDMNGLRTEDANKELNRLGIRMDNPKQGMLISNTADGMARLLKGTPWASNWGGVLKRLPGARAAGVKYFGYPGSNARATWIKRNGW